jgi:hypothetical protein
LRETKFFAKSTLQNYVLLFCAIYHKAAELQRYTRHKTTATSHSSFSFRSFVIRVAFLSVWVWGTTRNRHRWFLSRVSEWNSRPKHHYGRRGTQDAWQRAKMLTWARALSSNSPPLCLRKRRRCLRGGCAFSTWVFCVWHILKPSSTIRNGIFAE